MHEEHHETERTEHRARISWAIFAAVAAFYLWTEHRAHLLGVLPYLLLLACPLMHVFMHHSHHHGHSAGKPGEKPTDKGESP
ncbi:MAG: DUF2933 domain-containing protein [Betaproteobacteria bacterium]|nr:DUF2933 domain-containing protein [Betaproteobacteria bacterium]